MSCENVHAAAVGGAVGSAVAFPGVLAGLETPWSLILLGPGLLVGIRWLDRTWLRDQRTLAQVLTLPLAVGSTASMVVLMLMRLETAAIVVLQSLATIFVALMVQADVNAGKKLTVRQIAWAFALSVGVLVLGLALPADQGGDEVLALGSLVLGASAGAAFASWDQSSREATIPVGRARLIAILVTVLMILIVVPIASAVAP